MSERKRDDRIRNFATIVYEESASENWKNILAEMCVPCFISPYHDKDIFEDGSKKKPHWHVMIMFEGKKSDQQVIDIFSKIGGVGLERVQSAKGMARYFCHLDNPEKAKYNTCDVIQYGGADYLDVISRVSDKYKIIKEMAQWCRNNDIYSYADLFDYASENVYDWFKVLCDSGTVVMKEYLKSLKWTSEKKKLDEEWNKFSDFVERKDITPKE